MYRYSKYILTPETQRILICIDVKKMGFTSAIVKVV